MTFFVSESDPLEEEQIEINENKKLHIIPLFPQCWTHFALLNKYS